MFGGWDSTTARPAGFNIIPIPLNSSSNDLEAVRLERVCSAIQEQGYNFGEFIVKAIRTASDPQITNTHQKLIQMVCAFLDGRVKQYDIVQVMEAAYKSRFSAPRAIRESATPSEEKNRPDERDMARWKMNKWAVGISEGLIDREAENLASVKGGLRVAQDTTWEFADNFSLSSMAEIARQKAPVAMRLLTAVAIPRRKRQARAVAIPEASEPVPGGKGQNRRNPHLIVIVTMMMLLNARNLRFTALQKFFGAWLFSNSASREIYDILGRIGLSVSYSTVRDVLDHLSESARKTIQTEALKQKFCLGYDNINRKRRVWDPELGDKDVMDSGTAAAFIVLEDCDTLKAFDVEILDKAREEKRRLKLDVGVLESRIDAAHLDAVMVVHVVSFLVQHVPKLGKYQETLNTKLRTELAKHRMRKGRRTQAFPMETSAHDEGSARGNQKVIDDLMLRQLKLEEDVVKKVIVIITGDQSTIEKIRTLKRLLESCEHGYAQYGWVLPLIQLWHMGWADLERILATHWGSKNSGDSQEDPSTFVFVNELLGRKVKNVKRPDYYPAQALVFDTLRAEVLDCWCEYFDTGDLVSYVQSNEPTLDQLLDGGKYIVRTYLTTAAAEDALDGFERAGFRNGAQWHATGISNESGNNCGDHVLANTILRMRDSMLHYEFHSSIADGDIGRAMNIMAVWTFTFCGAGKSKYTNELLELACSFHYEFSEELKTAVLNNWLCNLTGQEGRYFPMDLLLEHNVNLLKAMTPHRDAPFGEKFFQETISLNIRYFLAVKENMRSALRLGTKGGSHHRKKKERAMEKLRKTMREHELHRLRKSRTYGFKAQDDYAEGYDRFDSTSRISDFVQRTLTDSANIDESDNAPDTASANQDNRVEVEGNTSDVDEPQAQPVVPSIWEDGELILGEEMADSDSDLEYEDV